MQFYTDFSEYPDGPLENNDWTVQWDDGASWTVSSGEVDIVGDIFSLISWDAVGDVEDVELYVTFDFEGESFSLRPVLRATGDEGNADGYYLSGRSNFGQELDVGLVDDGVGSDFASQDGVFSDDPHHMRFSVEGNELKARGWEEGTEEPTSWDVETTNSEITGNGSVGIGTGNSDGVALDFGIGTDGDPAPTEPVAQDIDGDVFAHDTDAAAVTGVRTRGASISAIDVDLSTVAGETTAVGPWESLEDLDPPRARFGVAGLDGLVHVIGGQDRDTTSATNSVVEYNPDTDTWSGGTTLPRDMDYGAATSDGDSIFFVGGDPIFSSPYTHVMEFDGSTWSDFEPLPTARASVGMAADDDYVVVGCGRDDDDHYDDIDIYDRGEDEWIQTTHPGGVRDSLGVALDDGVVYFGGGGDSSGEHDDFYRYDIDADSTTQLADLPLADRLSSMDFVNGTIFCVITNGDDPFPVYSVAHDEWTTGPDPSQAFDRGGTYHDGWVYSGGGITSGEVWERLEQAVPAAHTNLEAVYHE